jgi:cytochrome P450
MTTAADSQALLLHLLDPSNRADPYPAYAQIREHGPLQLPGMALNVFSSFQDCDDVLRHPSSASDRLKSTAAQREIAEGAEARPVGPPGFLFLDPPDHTRLRKLVSKAFVPKVVKALEPDITALVDGLLDTVEEQGSFDVIADLAYPLPVAVICRLLGVPIEDEPKFSRASALLAAALDPVISFTGQAPDSFDEMFQAGLWLREYLRNLIAHRRSGPGDDLRHPSQWAALSADPQRVSAVVEETLRYDPPVQLMGRIAADDMTIGETLVPKGDVMILLLAAAHHDPAAFDRPDEFDPDRENIRHLGFGKGPHFCLGAPLARLEAAVALSKVTARFPQARMAGEPQYKPNLTLRGLAALEVAV